MDRFPPDGTAAETHEPIIGGVCFDEDSSGRDCSVNQRVYDIHGWPASWVKELQNITDGAYWPFPGGFRDSLASRGSGPAMAVIPAGSFLMGSPSSEEGRASDEGPQHIVTIRRLFAIGVYAVTFDEYDAFCAATGRNKPEDQGWGRGSRPVINVSWYGAVAYCEWLSQETGHTYRLPSEAEWEYACRAGSATPFHFGETITTDQA
jgi:formylglycine-generating enzyme required for sulfatase activity